MGGKTLLKNAGVVTSVVAGIVSAMRSTTGPRRADLFAFTLGQQNRHQAHQNWRRPAAKAIGRSILGSGPTVRGSRRDPLRPSKNKRPRTRGGLDILVKPPPERAGIA